MRAGWRVMMIVVAGGAACGGARPAPAAPPEAPEPAAASELPHRAAWMRIEEPRPAIDVGIAAPDLHDDLRWPLAMSQHPVLEPQFAIGPALADPSVPWQDLCGRGMESRRDPAHQDEIAYLRGWCSAIRNDADTAVARLAPLRHSVVAGLAAAVRADLPNVLAEERGSDANRLLAKYHVVEPAVLDALAATYVEIGRLDDAAEINHEAGENDGEASDATRCHRIARAALLSPGDRPYLIEHAMKPLLGGKVVDPTCARLDTALRCIEQVPGACQAYAKGLGLDPRLIDLLDAYTHWPRGPAGWDAWWLETQAAYRAYPAKRAEELFVPAAFAALRVSGCTADRVRAVRSVAENVRITAKPPLSSDPQLAQLATIDPDACTRLAR